MHPYNIYIISAFKITWGPGITEMWTLRMLRPWLSHLASRFPVPRYSCKHHDVPGEFSWSHHDVGTHTGVWVQFNQVCTSAQEGPPIIGGKARWKFPQKCSDWSRHASKKTKICSDCPPKCQICSDWPRNYHFCLAKCNYTNKLCHKSFPVHPISIGTHCTWLPLAFLPCSYNRSHWFERVSSVQDNKHMRNSENSSGRGVEPQSWIFLGVSTPSLSDLQNQEKMYQWSRKL